MTKDPGETPLAFCRRKGWAEYVYQMLLVDYLILNRDRHGANIEILRNRRSGRTAPAPLFDHGLSLLYSCRDEREAENFDVMRDLPVSKVDLGPWLRADPSMKRLLQDDSAFHSVRLQPGGQGICWGENLWIAAEELCRNGESLPLTGRDLRLLIQGEVLDTAGVCSMLQCSRQYVDRLVREGTLRILNEKGKTRMYDRSDVERLTW